MLLRAAPLTITSVVPPQQISCCSEEVTDFLGSNRNLFGPRNLTTVRQTEELVEIAAEPADLTLDLGEQLDIGKRPANGTRLGTVKREPAEISADA
jgi:hypothetical protein